MIRTLVVSIMWTSWCCTGWSTSRVENVDQLVESVPGPQDRFIAKERDVEIRGCGPGGCSTDTANLNIGERGTVRALTSGRRLRIEAHPAEHAKSTSRIDWLSPFSYPVMVGGKRWGDCMTFPNAGLDNSGTFQRWVTSMVVPWKGGAPGSIGYRFTGYWNDCSMLVPDRMGTQDFSYSVLESVTTAPVGLRLARYHCALAGCTRTWSKRKVRGDPFSTHAYLVLDGE